jgi:predicted dehydrogenase
MNRRQFTKTTALLAASGMASTMSAANSKKIKIAQIGTAHAHASGKMEAFRKFPKHFEVVGFAESDEKIWETNKNNKVYSGLKRFTVDELLNIKNLDAVAIETDLPDLLPMAKKTLLAGKHIHLDKPPGKSLRNFETIVKIAKFKKLVFQMGYMFRYNPAFLFMLDTLNKGWLGDIFEIDGVMSKVLNPASRKIEGPVHGGSMMLLGCHLVDMLIAVMGKPEKVTPYRRQTLTVDNVYDNELAVFEYPKATCTIRSALVEVEGWERRQFVVCGTKGTIEIKPLEDPVLKLSLDRPRERFKKGAQFVELKNNGDRYDEQVLDFSKMIHGEKKPDYSYDHDLITQEAVLKASSLL